MNFIKHFPVILLVVIYLILSDNTTVVSGAEDEVNECIPSDVLFVIDQSASMRENDGAGNRFDAIRSVIDALYLNAAIECEGIVTHRIAVTGFNEYTETILPFQQIFVRNSAELDSNLDSIWLNESKNIQMRINSSLISVRGGTNVKDALFDANLNSARELFSRLTPFSDDSIRKRVLIFVTDGQPDGCNSRGSCTAYFNEFESNLTNQLDPLNISVNVLLFYKDDIPMTSWNLENLWANLINGQERGTYQSIQTYRFTGAWLSDSVNQIIEDVLELNSKTQRCQEWFTLEPYRDSVVIVSSARPNAATHIQVFGPGEIEYSEETQQDHPNLDVLQLDTVIRYIITNPVPGQWMIDGDPALCDEISPSLQTSSVQAEILPLPQGMTVNLNEPYYTDNADSYLRVRLTDKRYNAPFNEIDGHPLNIIATIRDADNGNVIHESLRLVKDDEDGIWISETPLPAPYQGKFEVNIKASFESISVTNTGLMIDLFELPNGDESPPTYVPATPADLVIIPQLISKPGINGSYDDIAREEDGKYIYHLNDIDQEHGQTHQPVWVSVQLTHIGTSLPLDLNYVFRNRDGTHSYIDTSIEAVLSGPDGISDSITLMLDPNDPTRLMGALRENRVDISNIATLDTVGEYEIEFIFSGGENYNRDNYRFTSLSSSIIVERLAILGVTLVAEAIPEQILLNTIQNIQRINNPIPISVSLEDHNGNSLIVSDVFSNYLEENMMDGIVSATLYDSHSRIIDTQSLTLSDNIFHTTLVNNNHSALDAPGVYRLEVYFSDPTLVNKRIYRLLTLENYPLRQDIQRIPRLGVSVQSLDGLQGTVQSLNTIDFTTGQQVAQQINLVAQLVDLDGNSYALPEIKEFVRDDINQLVYAFVTDPNGRRSQRVDLMANEAGVFQGTIKHVVDDPTKTIDDAGEYIITYFIDNDQFDDDNLSQYQIIDPTVEVAFSRIEKQAVHIRFLEIGGQSIVSSPYGSNVDLENSQIAVTIPLYLDVSEAIGIPLLPGDSVPQSVPFYISIRDTNDIALGWEDIIDSNIKFFDNVTNEEALDADLSPDLQTGAEVDELIQEELARNIVLSDFLQVAVINSNGDIFPVNELEALTYKDEPALYGLIDSQATLDGVYLLRVSSQSNVLREDVQILGDAIQQLPFKREITKLWLNPLFWSVIEIIINLLLFIWILLFIYNNFLNPMKGCITINFTDGSRDPQKRTLPLKGIRWGVRNKKKETFNIQQHKDILEIKVIVSKVSRQTNRQSSKPLDRYRVQLIPKGQPGTETYIIEDVKSSRAGRLGSVSHNTYGCD